MQYIFCIYKYMQIYTYILYVMIYCYFLLLWLTDVLPWLLVIRLVLQALVLPLHPEMKEV